MSRQTGRTRRIRNGLKPPSPHLEPALLVVLGLLFSCFSCAVGEADAQPVRRSMPETPITAAEMVGVRGLSGMAVSPDGAFVAVRQDEQRLDTNTTDLTWFIVSLRGDAIVRAASAGAPSRDTNGGLAPEWPVWSEDSQWLYYRAIAGEEAQVWRTSRDGAIQQQVTHDLADVEAYSVDAGELHYATRGATRDEILSAEQVEYDHGVRLDATIVPGFAITRNFPVNGRMATHRQLPGVGRSTLLGERPALLKTIDLARGTVSVATGATADAYERRWSVGAGRFSEVGGGRFNLKASPATRLATPAPDGGGVASVEKSTGGQAPGRSGSQLLWRPSEGKEIRCSAPSCLEADGIALVGWTQDSQAVVFQTVTFGHEAIHLWDFRRNRVRTIAELDGVIGSQRSGAVGVCQLANREAVCIRSGPAAPPRLVAIDLKSGAQRTLFDPNPSLPVQRFGRVEKISVKDRFGAIAYGWLVLPRSYTPGQRLPLVITSYTCGGFLRGGSGEDVPEHVLAGQGFAALCLEFGYTNVRRPPGMDIAETGNEGFLDMFEDAVRILSERGIVDPDRVLVSGFSGSASATTFAIANSARFTAAIITTQGYLDPINAYLSGARDIYRRGNAARGYELPYDDRDNPSYAKSPAWAADRISTPLLMQLADVEYPPMMQLVSAMLDYGRSVEMWIFPNAYHFKFLPRQRLTVYERNVDWANFWLRGVERETAGDAEQTLRWRAMRDKQCRLVLAPTQTQGPSRPWYCRG